ncbi:hypothetical protein FF098_003040 [Parvularcula flava]|uniref:Uncharacterized protein n=1 Tax=Aquisalinus luteolus TaxID=1566827 RepID=A0A8J3A0M7_9PROT|nr:hypothetical protein [Aquisalinus luteolus]NHK26882.1 hypothetical protein [Aquisalinus luteolus]GGH93701.1 hypothetical protein GCM10011355_06160 [Aquisalinus luteolus]
MTRILLAASAAIALIAACSGEPEDAPDPRAPQADPEEISERAADDAAPASQTQGGDGSALVLSPLTAADRRANQLDGELGCAFTLAGDDAPLFIGAGYAGVDEPAYGLIKIASTVERVTSQTADGFGGMEDGGRFSGRGMTIEISPTGEDRADHEGLLQDATLTAMRGDGAERTWSGDWTCGP